MKLKFKHQPFQAEAAEAVCDVFAGQPRLTSNYRIDIGEMAYEQQRFDDADLGFRNHPLVPSLTANRLLDNLRKVQIRHHLKPSDALAGPGINLTIEMETGTGKTYTYIKTMYELNRRYGWSKFIIVVPSVAIREGVAKSFSVTQEHFSEEYGKKIRFFTYSSDKLSDVESFASGSGIYAMIINMQAFNSSKNQKIIDKKRDSFRSRRPIDVITQTNPILIIDEPQSVEGKKTKESLRKFNALFTLRYSATHKDAYNMVYRLDAMDAYNKHLVKRIAALGVSLTGTTATNSPIYLESVQTYPNKAPTARLGFEVKGRHGSRMMVRKVGDGDDLYVLSGGLEEYADRFIIRPGGIDGRDNSVTFLNGLKLFAGQMSGNEEMTAVQRRIQIRETIRTHIERERDLYAEGIKVLSLFFIDEVSKYRIYEDGDEDGRNGDYAKMFEEEYRNVVGHLQRKFGDEAYMAYLDGIDVRETHQGYFSIDKKRGKKPRFVEGKISRKTQTSDDADAYDLIMKDKERLLSFKEPVRFIFSHSALREGWDNPNVFQICTLKPQSESEIRSRQEIGRGLRLCVNQEGERMDEGVLGAEVQEVNKLTLITDMDFGKFAEALQSGLADSLDGRPYSVEPELFVGKVISNAHGKTKVLSKEDANAICVELTRKGYLEDGQLTEKYFEDKEANCLVLAEEVEGYEASVIEIVSSIYDPRAMCPENVHGNNVEATVDQKKLDEDAFQELWKRINKKSLYRVDFDSKQLIKNSIRAFEHFHVSSIQFNVEYGEQVSLLDSREQLERGEGFEKRSMLRETSDAIPLGSVHYDLVGKLVEETGLTRATIAKILKGMPEHIFSQFKRNPEEFIIKAGHVINTQKATEIIEHITYDDLKEEYGTEIFTGQTLRGQLGVNAMVSSKSLYSHVIYDSKTERDFAKDLDKSSQVAVYVKLPSSFFISTPVGKYNPDWAIAFEEGSVKHIYFVAETKGTLDSMELRGIEQVKIECAREHFKAISGSSVVYDVVSDYKTLMGLVTGER